MCVCEQTPNTCVVRVVRKGSRRDAEPACMPDYKEGRALRAVCEETPNTRVVRALRKGKQERR